MPTWSDDYIILLKQLWGLGLSASMIARRLGGDCTCSAVIGKVHRVGLPHRTTVSHITGHTHLKRRSLNKANGHHQTVSQERVKRVQLAQERTDAQSDPDLHIVRDDRGRLIVNDRLDARARRWTYGTGSKGDPYYCCGKPTLPGLSFCEFHARRAFNATQPEPRRWPSSYGHVRHVADVRSLEVLEQVRVEPA